jgi:toxin-antitoxin system PIN domain toxin
VNILLALTDPLHVHHEAATRWFDGAEREWATCPITENGFVRVLSHPNYPGRPGNADVALEILRAQRRLPGWEFWADEVSILDTVLLNMAITHSQVTDVYLLGLAAARGGKLATLDGRINASAVRGGREALHVIEP